MRSIFSLSWGVRERSLLPSMTELNELQRPVISSTHWCTWMGGGGGIHFSWTIQEILVCKLLGIEPRSGLTSMKLFKHSYVYVHACMIAGCTQYNHCVFHNKNGVDLVLWFPSIPTYCWLCQEELWLNGSDEALVSMFNRLEVVGGVNLFQ